MVIVQHRAPDMSLNVGGELTVTIVINTVGKLKTVNPDWTEGNVTSPLHG